ncbi:MAG: FxLYD domain-containing protein [Pyrinomonadaceae bacterium]|nr:FxLYD domain-containing protein [Pyrinomonadaceae bacterium]
MKICTICHSEYPDNTFFCLDDGNTLVNQNDFDGEQTLSFAETPTIQDRSRVTLDGNQQYFQPQYTNYAQLPKQGPQPLAIVGGILGVFLMIAAGLAVGGVYLKSKIKEFPTPTPRSNITPYQTPYNTPTPEEKVQLKIEPAGKVKGSFGQQFLKFMVTNPSEKIVATPDIPVTLYQGDVKVGGTRGESKLKYLKPGQTIPVWADLGYGNVKFTDAKVETQPIAKTVNKSEAQIFPQITISDTKMDITKETSSFNDYNYTENWYNVTGVVENTNYETISAEIVVIFYDANSNIVGISETYISDLKRGEKEKFEVGAGEISELFGKPKRFEIIVTDRRFH